MISLAPSACIDNQWYGSLGQISPEKGYWLLSQTHEILITIGQKYYTTEFDLHFGLNLISYNCSSDGNLNELIQDLNVLNIIGEGVAATRLPNGEWVGSLDALQTGKGYWFNTSDATILNYECPDTDSDVSSRKKNSR